MAGWWKKIRVMALAGILAGGTIAQAQSPGQQLPVIPSPLGIQSSTVIPPYPPPVVLTKDQHNRSQSAANPLPTGTAPLPTQVILQPGPNQPPLGDSTSSVPVYEGEIVTNVQEIQTNTCETCSKPGAKWLVRHKIFPAGRNHADSVPRYVSEGEGGKCGIFGPHCYSHHDDYYPCTTFWTQFCFIFGSCRNFYGNPCRQGPMPVPVPPGYSLPPGPYGY